MRYRGLSHFGRCSVLPMVLLVLAIVTCAFGARSSQAGAGSGEGDLLLHARQAEKRGDYQTAAANYGAFLKLHPGVPEVTANLGLMQFMAGEYKDAQQSLESSLRAKPGLLSANLFLGLDLLKLHRPEQALRYLQIADKAEPGNAMTMVGLGDAYAGAQQLEKADKIYAEVLRAHPRNLDALYGLGTASLGVQEEASERLAYRTNNSPYAEILLAEAFILQQRVGDAARICEKLLAAYSTFEGLHTVLGFADLQLGRFRAAEDAFRGELKSRPGYLPAQLGSAALDLLQGSEDKGLKEVEEIQKTDNNFLDFHAGQLWAALTPDQLSSLQGELKNVPAASRESAIANDLLQNINSPDAINVRGDRGEPPGPHTHFSGSAAELYAGGHYTACTERMAGAQGLAGRSDLLLMMPCSYYAGDYWTTFLSSSGLLARDSGNPEALFWLSKAAMKLASGALTEAGTINPNSPRMHVLRAETFGLMKQYENAEAEFQKAIQLRPEDLAAHLGLGTVYWRQMKFDAAEPELSWVLAANPSDAQASYMMGNILVTRHQFERSEPLLKTGSHAGGEVGLRARETLGKAYLSVGRTHDAIAELRQALPVDRDGSIHYQLYLAYKKEGDEGSAMAALRESEMIRKRREASAFEKLSLSQ